MPDATMPPALAEHLQNELLAAIDRLEEAAQQPKTAAGETEALGKIEEAMRQLDGRRRLGLAWCFEYAHVTLRLLAARLGLRESSVTPRIRDEERRQLEDLI
jgi:beta-phosphoglucomutase-like phosphatase (HAD superfamily)